MIARAFEFGVTDIIAFDYGNPELDAIKDKVRAQMLQAAKANWIPTGVLFRGFRQRSSTCKNKPQCIIPRRCIDPSPMLTTKK